MTHSIVILRKTSGWHDERDNNDLKLLEILYSTITISKHNWSCFETKQNISFEPSKKIMCTKICKCGRNKMSSIEKMNII